MGLEHKEFLKFGNTAKAIGVDKIKIRLRTDLDNNLSFVDYEGFRNGKKLLDSGEIIECTLPSKTLSEIAQQAYHFFRSRRINTEIYRGPIKLSLGELIYMDAKEEKYVKDGIC